MKKVLLTIAAIIMLSGMACNEAKSVTEMTDAEIIAQKAAMSRDFKEIENHQVTITLN